MNLASNKSLNYMLLLVHIVLNILKLRSDSCYPFKLILKKFTTMWPPNISLFEGFVYWHPCPTPTLLYRECTRFWCCTYPGLAVTHLPVVVHIKLGVGLDLRQVNSGERQTCTLLVAPNLYQMYTTSGSKLISDIHYINKKSTILLICI